MTTPAINSASGFTPDVDAMLDAKFVQYTEKDLVEFGNFLLERYGSKARVTDPALQNWKDSRVASVTEGEKFFSVQFNPNGDPSVHAVKVMSARLYDYFRAWHQVKQGGAHPQEIVAAANISLLHAQMDMVKCITWK